MSHRDASELTRRELLTIGGLGAAGLAVAALGCGERERADTTETTDEPENPLAEQKTVHIRGGTDHTVTAADNDKARGQPADDDAEVPQVPRRTLGRTGRDIPILLVGGSMPWNQTFDAKLPEALRHGANYFDSARNYGGSETALAAFHEKTGVRDKIWLTSKSKRHDPEGFETTLGESLERLRTDRVDMYFLHALKDPDALSSDLARTVERLKKSSKMHFFGFSCHHGNVAELLTLAAQHRWIDAIMFRYNFRDYGNRELNRAIDAAHKAGIGLIAMKTQGSEASFRSAWQRFEQTGKWNKYQSVLKAVWSDERITAAVSEMDSFDKLHQNLAAALDTRPLSWREQRAVERYALATRNLACDGCDHLCGPAVASPTAIGDTMRYLMYHDVYGKPDSARALYRSLPLAARRAHKTADFRAAEAACPHGLALGAHMRRAGQVLG